MTRALTLLCAGVLAGCAAPQVFVPPEQAARLERSLVGEDRFLRVSMHQAPFFGDATKKLLSPVDPELVRLLDNPDKTPVNPGAVERTFPAGTPVRIRKVEFPSSLVMAERVLYTPRTLAWVYVDVAGTPKSSPPFVLVLRPGLKTEAEVLTELERYLSREDPAKLLEGASEAVREAVKTKSAIVDMPAAALEMAWGYPDVRRIELVGEQKKETWSWAGKRTATLLDGRVTELKK